MKKDLDLYALAKAFVACPGWFWHPGMLVQGRVDGRNNTPSFRLSVPFGPDEPTTVTRTEERKGRTTTTRTLVHPELPVLKDDMTRLGTLLVLRRAWGDPFANTGQDWIDGRASGTWFCHVQGKDFTGDTEIEAILSALQASPQKDEKPLDLPSEAR